MFGSVGGVDLEYFRNLRFLSRKVTGHLFMVYHEQATSCPCKENSMDGGFLSKAKATSG